MWKLVTAVSGPVHLQCLSKHVGKGVHSLSFADVWLLLMLQSFKIAIINIQADEATISLQLGDRRCSFHLSFPMSGTAS